MDTTTPISELSYADIHDELLRLIAARPVDDASKQRIDILYTEAKRREAILKEIFEGKKATNAV